MSAVREQACTRKRRLGEGAARAVARKAPELRAYRCPYCREYHVGHPPSMDTLRRIAADLRGLEPGSNPP